MSDDETTVEEATPEVSLSVGITFVRQALRKLTEGDTEHAAVDLEFALIWLRGAQS